MFEFNRVLPEEAGISSASILRFLKEMKAYGIELHSFMIVRDGVVAGEGWAAPYRKETLHPMYSFSKTLTAVAIGFAVQEGILSLNDKLVDIFPEYCPPSINENLGRADIKSLLTMSCGHEREMNIWEADRYHGNWIRAFLDHPFLYTPGIVFQYNTWGSDVLSAIIQKKTGQRLVTFLKPRLFDPLGITDAVCASRNMGDDFTSTVQGGGWGFKLTTDDMAKFMWFLEQDGIWQGKRLLNHEWIAQMSARQVETNNPFYNNGHIKSNWLCGYGFQNWQCTMPGTWRADGAFGQFGIVIPKKNAVVCLTSAALNTEAEVNIVLRTLVGGMAGDAERTAMSDLEIKTAADMEKVVCNAVPMKVSGPEAASDQKALEEYLKDWRCPELWGIRAPLLEETYGEIRFKADFRGDPSIQDFVSGPGYYEKDGLSTKAVTWHFEDGQVRLEFELNKEPEAAPTPEFTYDPFSPAGRTIPKGNEHLICHDDDPATAVTETLVVGTDGNMRLSRLTTATVAATGTFLSPSTFEIDARNIETTASVRIHCTFFRGMLNLEATGTIPEESPLTFRTASGMHFTQEDCLGN